MSSGGRGRAVDGADGGPEEVGRLCLFIAAEATFTTGVDHVISGGAELGYGPKSRSEQHALSAGALDEALVTASSGFSPNGRRT